MAIKYTKWPQYIPNGHRIYQLFKFQGPPKFAQIWILGLKIYHLATLVMSMESLKGFYGNPPTKFARGVDLSKFSRPSG
jgi:hypothetical protein